MKQPSLSAQAGSYADLVGSLVALLHTEADPVPVADRLLVVAMAACRDLRAARERVKEREQDRRQ